MKMLIPKEQRPDDILLYNVGLGLDIPTSIFLRGQYGETIVVGGIGPFTGVAGFGNNFKSTIMHHLTLTAVDRFLYSSSDVSMHTYDTELTLLRTRLLSLASKHPNIMNVNNLLDGEDAFWTLANKASFHGEDWIKLLVESGTKMLKSKPKKVKITCLKNLDGKYPLEIIPQIFVEVDSLTKMSSKRSAEISEGKGLDDKKSNTIALIDGNVKQKFMDMTPKISKNFGVNFLMAVHLGKNINMDGPKYGVVQKEIQHISSDDKFMGATPDFNRYPTAILTIGNASELKNKETKKAEFPLDSDELISKDLFTVPISITRSKTGVSAAIAKVVVSQTEGVQPELTDFLNIKENNRYGLEGGNTSYNCVFYPEVKISRTTVRRKILTDAKLARAVNIAYELLQCHVFKLELKVKGLLCSPEELYNDIKERGYDWNTLLEARGWWTPDQYNTEIKPLSIVDLLEVRAGLYHPYWYPTDKIDNPAIEVMRKKKLIK